MTRGLTQLLLALLTQAVFAAGMTSNEVARVLAQAIARAQQIEPQAVIAVVDREGFGRRIIPMHPDEIGRMVVTQIGALGE